MGDVYKRELSSSMLMFCFFQAEDGIRDLVRSRGLGDVYKRQLYAPGCFVTNRMIATVVTERKLERFAAQRSAQQLSLIHI